MDRNLDVELDHWNDVWEPSSQPAGQVPRVLSEMAGFGDMDDDEFDDFEDFDDDFDEDFDDDFEEELDDEFEMDEEELDDVDADEELDDEELTEDFEPGKDVDEDNGAAE